MGHQSIQGGWFSLLKGTDVMLIGMLMIAASSCASKSVRAIIYLRRKKQSVKHNADSTNRLY